MRFGTAGYPSGTKTPKDGLDTVKKLGLDALEIEFVRGVRISDKKAKDIGVMAKERDIRLSAHAPYFINFNSNTQEIRDKSVQWTIDTVRAAHMMGAYIVVIHAASYGKLPETATDSVIKGLLRCKSIMDDEKIDNVILGIETMGKKGQWGTLKEIERVMDDIPGVHPVLDVAHVHARGTGQLKSEKEMKELTDKFFLLSGDVPHFHISCIMYGEKGEISHLPLEAKEPDMQILSKVLTNCKFDCNFICESPLQEIDAVTFKNMFMQ